MKKSDNKSQNSIKGIIVKAIILSLLLLILGISAIIMIKANMFPEKIPDVMGYKPMIVLSGSMETSIYTGDLVIVQTVDAENFKDQYIIAFRNEANTVTTHRIVKVIEENGNKVFETKGDNNNVVDNKLVEVSEIEGVYCFRIPKLGKILMILKEPTSLVVILLTILVIGMMWIHIIEKKENKQDEKYKKEFEEFKKRQQEINNK